MKCAILGDHKIRTSHELIEYVTDKIKYLVQKKHITRFITGGTGDFDTLVVYMIRRLAIEINMNLSITLYLPYITNGLLEKQSYLEEKYDNIVICNSLDVRPIKSILYRNHKLVDDAGIVLSCFKNGNCSSYYTILYARSQRKNIQSI